MAGCLGTGPAKPLARAGAVITGGLLGGHGVVKHLQVCLHYEVRKA